MIGHRLSYAVARDTKGSISYCPYDRKAMEHLHIYLQPIYFGVVYYIVAFVIFFSYTWRIPFTYTTNTSLHFNQSKNDVEWLNEKQRGDKKVLLWVCCKYIFKEFKVNIKNGMRG